MSIDLLLRQIIQEWVLWGTVVVFLLGGLWVLAAQPRALLNRAMGAFLLLYAGSTAAFQQLRVARLESAPYFPYLEALFQFEIAFPFLTGLVAIGLFAQHGRSRRQQVAITALVLALVVVLAANALFARQLFHAMPGPANAWAPQGERLPLAVAHGGLWVVAQAGIVLLGALAARSGGLPSLQRRQAALVGLAFAFPLGAATIFRVATLLASPSALWRGPPGEAILFAAYPALFPLVLWAWTQFPTPFRGRARQLVILAALGTVGLSAYEAVATTWQIVPWSRFGGFRPVYLAALAVVHVVAAVQYDVAGSGHAKRRDTRRAVVGLSVAALAAVPAGLLVAQAGLGPAELAAIGTSVVLLTTLAGPWLTDGFGGLVGRADGAPRRRAVDLRTAVASYRAAIAGVNTPGGRLAAGHGPALSALRTELGLTDRDHDVLVASLDGDDPGGDVPRVLLARYIVEEELGRGGSATVYRARDPVHGRTVVIKRFHVSPSARRAFLKEARTLSRFRDPRVVSLYDTEEVEDDLILVLELAEGRTLGDRLNEGGPSDPDEAVDVTLQVLDALDAVHAAGFVHGDIKPSNVLLDAVGRVKLGDFGSAKISTGDLDATRTLQGGSGTLSTMAPEQVAGEPPAEASDTYAVGALLYRLLTGEHYLDFESGNELMFRDRILHHPPRLPHPRVPVALEGVLVRALAKEPGDRFSNAPQMARALQAVRVGRRPDRGGSPGPGTADGTAG